jgi:hypothetical protein
VLKKGRRKNVSCRSRKPKKKEEEEPEEEE